MQSSTDPESKPWYKILSNYQWTVLIVASLGWIFDVFEGQIFVASMREVMPYRVRPITSSIFHASSVFGTLLSTAAGAYVVGNPELGENAWRWGFALGALPAALTIWIRVKLKEPDQWVKMQERSKKEAQIKPGSIPDLFKGRQLRSTLVGVSLASIGLVTFWGVHIYGKNALLEHAKSEALAADGVLDSSSGALVTQTLEKPENKTAMKKGKC